MFQTLRCVHSWRTGRQEEKKKAHSHIKRFSQNTLLQQEYNHAISPLPQNHFKNVCWQHNKDTNKRKRRPMNSSRHLHSSRRLKTRRMHYNVLLKLNTPHVFNSSHQDTWNEPKKTQLDVVKKKKTTWFILHLKNIYNK